MALCCLSCPRIPTQAIPRSKWLPATYFFIILLEIGPRREVLPDRQFYVLVTVSIVGVLINAISYVHLATRLDKLAVGKVSTQVYVSNAARPTFPPVGTE